jgi:hypothetical protein
LRKLKDAPAEYFIIAEGGSNVQVVAIADEVDSYVRTQTHVHPLGIDGRDNAEWIAMDMEPSLYILCNVSHVPTTTLSTCGLMEKLRRSLKCNYEPRAKNKEPRLISNDRKWYLVLTPYSLLLTLFKIYGRTET